MDNAKLIVTDHHAAIYWNEVRCSFIAHPGKIKFSETEILVTYYRTPNPESCALEILKVTDEEITFVVPGIFSGSKEDTVGTVHPGEEKKFVNTYMDRARWDGDDISFEVEDRLEVMWVKE